jgi:hypothetical protein
MPLMQNHNVKLQPIITDRYLMYINFVTVVKQEEYH